MFRYQLRTLLIVLALGPPVLAAIWLWPDPVVAILLVLVLFGLLIAPIWAGVRHAELMKQRRAGRKRQK